MDSEDLTNEGDEQTRQDKRFTTLTEKVKSASAERDQLAAEKQKADEEKDAAKKEAEFYKGFNSMSTKYQGASDYQDKILEKVQAGYDIEDATISVMAKEGKLNNVPAPESRQSPAGGSATNAMSNGGEKSMADMTRQEKRAELEQIERESGDISRILRSNSL